MQSDLSNVPNTVSTRELAPDNVQTSQHGLHLDDDPPSLLPREQGRGAQQQHDYESSCGSRNSSPRRVAADIDDAARLNQGSPSSWTKIVEYENALVHTPRKKPEGPLFEVIKKKRNPDDKSCPIEKLPNGSQHLFARVI